MVYRKSFPSPSSISLSNTRERSGSLGGNEEAFPNTKAPINRSSCDKVCGRRFTLKIKNVDRPLLDKLPWPQTSNSRIFTDAKRNFSTIQGLDSLLSPTYSSTVALIVLDTQASSVWWQKRVVNDHVLAQHQHHTLPAPESYKKTGQNQRWCHNRPPMNVPSLAASRLSVRPFRSQGRIPGDGEQARTS